MVTTFAKLKKYTDYAIRSRLGTINDLLHFSFLGIGTMRWGSN